MGLESINEALQRLNTLREVDSVIDLSRGWLQLRIVVVLGYLKKLDVDGLAKLLGERKKAVLDALRKLRLKALITEVDEGMYLALSDEGRNLYSSILSIIVGTPVTSSENVSTLSIAEDLHRYLTRSFYLYEAIIALGTSRKYELPINTLASIVKLSPEVLDDYLKPYAENRSRVFKRLTPSRGFLTRAKGITYRLDDEGVKIYHRLPDYVKYKNDLKASILRTITLSGHPRIVLKRLSLMFSLGSAVIAITTTFLPVSLSLIITLTWVLMISFLALIIEMTY